MANKSGGFIQKPGAAMIPRQGGTSMKSLDMSKSFALKQPAKGPSFKAPKKP